ncbi:hypothetical protein A2U01_0019761, partial [Trifolium medium]|nr:hypothetical protein [Trifolium medium]
FCHYCNVIGHDQAHCKRANPDNIKLDLKQNVQNQKKVFTVAKDNRKAATLDPIVEVTNLEGSTSKAKPTYDPLLDSILMHIDDTRQEASAFNSPSNVSPTLAQATPQSDQNLTTPERALKDMQFLNASWANHAEQETEALVNNDVLGQQNDTPVANHFELLQSEEPFQLVGPKKKGKKSNTTPHKNTYSTRSKVDQSNLGK